MSQTSQEPSTAKSPNGHQLLFAYGNLMQGLPCGHFNAMLPDFVRWHKGHASCKESVGTQDHLYGRVIEISDDFWPRLDTWAERTADYHRFLADVQIIGGPILKGVWVFQMIEHASPETKATSANVSLREDALPLQNAA